MKKVIVIGCPGSGKSTFSRALHEKTGLPLYYLDLFFWNADKTTVPKPEFLNRIETVLKQEEWILDGNYSSSLPRRLEVCDTVFFLDFPLEVCLSGVRSRRGLPRPDMPWIEEEEDPEFMDYIRDFHVNTLPELRRLLAQHPNKNVIVFHSRAELSAYLSGD